MNISLYHYSTVPKKKKIDINKKLTLEKNGKSYIVLRCKLWQSKWGRRGDFFLHYLHQIAIPSYPFLIQEIKKPLYLILCHKSCS